MYLLCAALHQAQGAEPAPASWSVRSSRADRWAQAIGSVASMAEGGTHTLGRHFIHSLYLKPEIGVDIGATEVAGGVAEREGQGGMDWRRDPGRGPALHNSPDSEMSIASMVERHSKV